MTTATGSIPTTVETPFPDRPNATEKPYERLGTVLPLAKGTRDGCVHYFDGADYQFNVTGTMWDNNCQIAIDLYGVDAESFAVWNGGLGNVSTECSFEEGVRYCGSYYMQKPDPSDDGPTSTSSSSPTNGTSTTATGPSPTAPTVTGQPSSCNKWHTIVNGDNCETVAKKYGLTKEQFILLNPGVSSDCTKGFLLDYAYCVGVKGSSTKTEPTATSTTPTRPSPTSPTVTGQPSNCSKWHTIVDGDNCETVAKDNGITKEQLIKWNPGISSDCTEGFWLDYAYCVKVSG